MFSRVRVVEAPGRLQLPIRVPANLDRSRTVAADAFVDQFFVQREMRTRRRRRSLVRATMRLGNLTRVPYYPDDNEALVRYVFVKVKHERTQWDGASRKVQGMVHIPRDAENGIEKAKVGDTMLVPMREGEAPRKVRVNRIEEEYPSFSQVEVRD